MADLLIKGMKMPKVCVTEDGWHGYCPMHRTWCSQRFAPSYYTNGMVYEEIMENIPEWCPLVEVPTHGRLIDVDAFAVENKGAWNEEEGEQDG